MHGRLRYLLFITSVNKHALSMWPPSISLGMFASLVRYVALIMFFFFFNFSIFQCQPLCSSYSGLVQKLFVASVTSFVDQTFVIFEIKFNSGHISTREPANKYCKKKHRIQQCGR